MNRDKETIEDLRIKLNSLQKRVLELRDDKDRLIQERDEAREYATRWRDIVQGSKPWDKLPWEDNVKTSGTVVDIYPGFVQTAFVFAARYVHHRNTGGTLAVIRALSYVWHSLSARTRIQIVSESREATANLREWREFRGDD